MEHAVGAHGMSGVPCRIVMSGTEAEQGCAVCHKHWLTSQGTPHMACGLPVKLEQQAGNVLLICSITSVRSVLVS